MQLRGMTWDHSRGFDPMVATSESYTSEHPEVAISWEKRSLQAFADRPIEQMASEFDLMVIDHPHVGEVARNGLLLPFDGQGRDDQLATLASQSVGVSHQSYEFANHQWSLAIDAATPVAARRPDLLAEMPQEWEEVLELARKGQVAFALIPINALMTFFGLARNRGVAIAEGPMLMDKDAALAILETMCEIVALLDPRCLKLDPIGIYDWLSSEANAPAYSPFGYGYTNYSRAGYCTYPLAFGDAPGFEGSPVGTVLGGTGIAISATCEAKEAALDYAFWIAGADCQRGLYFTSGGQPGNAIAWEDDACNAAAMDFFRNTRATLEGAWLRPRYDGYMQLQDRGGTIVHQCLTGELAPKQTFEQLQREYEASRQ